MKLFVELKNIFSTVDRSSEPETLGGGRNMYSEKLSRRFQCTVGLGKVQLFYLEEESGEQILAVPSSEARRL